MCFRSLTELFMYCSVIDRCISFSVFNPFITRSWIFVISLQCTPPFQLMTSCILIRILFVRIFQQRFIYAWFVHPVLADVLFSKIWWFWMLYCVLLTKRFKNSSFIHTSGAALTDFNVQLASAVWSGWFYINWYLLISRKNVKIFI